MNTGQIYSALADNEETRQIFRGVFASDQVPSDINPLPAGLVFNVDPTGQPGSHWIGLFQEKVDEVEIFDSYGKDLAFYHLAHLFNGCKVVSQAQQLQSDFSTVCGQYTMFFLLRRATGEPFDNILHLFSGSPVNNDVMIRQYVNHHFNLKTSVCDTKFLQQVCKQMK